MPELVACPTCGCKVQVADALLGRRTRCIACGKTFEAAPAPTFPESEPTGYPLQNGDEVDDTPPPPPMQHQHGPARYRLPLCPRCHRPVSWEALACPHCCHLLDPGDETRSGPWKRRDVDDHRGMMIQNLGSVCMVFGALSLCFPLGPVVAFGTGLPALIMANHDLARMRQNQMDPEGQPATEAGRNKAIVGMVLAVVCGVFLVLLITSLH